MKNLPETENALVLRTDFSDERAWESIRAAILRPVGIFQFRAYVDFVSDPAYAGISVDQLVAALPDSANLTFLFIVDQTALSHPERPILVLDLFEERGRTFRVIPSEMWSIENNLSIGNMDFADFADSASPDGIFRGFR